MGNGKITPLLERLPRVAGQVDEWRDVGFVAPAVDHSAVFEHGRAKLDFVALNHRHHTGTASAGECAECASC